MGAGILSCTDVKQYLHSNGAQPAAIKSIDAGKQFETKYVDLSSIDLPLGQNCWEMQGSCRTGRTLNVSDIIERYKKGGSQTVPDTGLVLKAGSVYLLDVDCELSLPKNIMGKATGRSSIGRLDVLVRLLVDGGDTFDRVPCGHSGKLYVEVTPISFSLTVRPGMSLSQLRLYRGKEHLVSVSREELLLEDDQSFPIVDETGKANRELCKPNERDLFVPFHLDLTEDPVVKCSAFKAKRDVQGAIDPDKRQQYNPSDYWEPVPIKDDYDYIRLDPDVLYILRSKERLRIPPHLALECKSYTEHMGEWRIEYAGFAHPYFGRSRPEGAPIIFEVRGHNVPTLLTDGIPLGNVGFKRMATSPDKPEDPGDYEAQELKLSKCFAPWPDNSDGA